MTDDDVREFAQRPWGEMARRKRIFWASEEITPEDRLRVADELRQFTASLHVNWPDETQRRNDLGAHIEVAQLLRRVADVGSS